LPLPVTVVVDRALAKSRTSRFSSVQDLSAAIEAAVPGATRSMALLGPPPVPRPELAAAVQRRRAIRAPYNTPVQVVMRGQQAQTMDGRSEDISEGGLLVLSRDGCASQQDVVVRFALPMEGKVISAEAHVRWVRASPALGVCAIGLEFVDLHPTVRASIATYVGLMADHNQA
jgi:hypothetical protein